MSRPLLLLLASLALVPSACGDDEESASSGAGGDERQTQSEGESVGAGACEEVEPPAPRPDGGAKEPARPLTPGKTYEVTLATNCGNITIRLDQKVSPKTAASFANLTRTGFFDGTTFHRIVPG